jgi:hypothetical protein
MKKTLKQIIQSAILAGAIALSSGCASTNHSKITKAHEPMYFDCNPRGQLTAAVYTPHLGKKTQTVPIHPADGGPSRGEATADIKWGFDMRFSYGIEGSFGTEKLRINAGLDGILDLGGIAPGGYRSGIYAVELQPLPASEGYESYAFTCLEPTLLTYMPFAGLEIKPSDKTKLGFEFGMPHNKFKFNKGHDRWGMWETTERDSWEGFGKSIGLYFTLEDRKGRDTLCWGISRESYDSEFLGEKGKIDIYLLSMKCKLGKD